MTTLVALVVVLMIVVQEINTSISYIKDLFGLNVVMKVAH